MMASTGMPLRTPQRGRQRRVVLGLLTRDDALPALYSQDRLYRSRAW
ncbi:hypothetical protein ACU4HD_46035 [Cupriavidus basilensis]